MMFWIGLAIGIVVGGVTAALLIGRYLLMPQVKTMTIAKDGIIALRETLRKTRESMENSQ